MTKKCMYCQSRNIIERQLGKSIGSSLGAVGGGFTGASGFWTELANGSEKRNASVLSHYR